MADIKVRIGQSDAIKVIASRQGVTGESATSAYANQSGISSSSSYAASAGIATYTTYAENSGIATNVIGGIGSVTQLNVSGLSTFSGNINIPDNISAKFGNDGDLELVHYDTNHSIIRHTGSGNLQIWGDSVQFNASNGVGPSLTVDTGIGVTVYGNTETQTLNVTGISTFNDDVVFTGQNTNARWDKSKSDLVLYNDTRLTLGSNEDFQMWHGGTNTFIKNTGGDLRIRGDVIKLQREDSSETYLKATVNSSVELYHGMGGSAAEKKIETTTTGAIVTGILTANQFKGDGSGLTGVTASGTGVNIRDDGSVIGVAATINFGQNLDVSPVSSGFVTVTAATVNQFTNLEVTGITTLSNLKISSGVITTTSGIVTYYGDVAQIDGGSY